MFDKLRKAVVGADLPTEPVVVRVQHDGFGAVTVTGAWDPRVVTVTGPWQATVVLSASSHLPEALRRRLGVACSAAAHCAGRPARGHADGRRAGCAA